MAKKTLSLIFYLCFVSLVRPNPVEYGISDIQYYSRQEYRGDRQNWNISQADNGLLYFANNGGLLEFDGTHWRMLPSHPNLMNNLTRSVFVDKGRIYIGAADEFGFYSKDSTGNFQYQSLSDKYNIPDLGDYWNIIKKDNQIIFQSHNGLCIYTPNTSVDFIPSNSRISEIFLVNGMLLAHDDMDGLMELRNDKLFKISGGKIFSGKTISAILPVSDNEIVIGTMDDGLYRWNMTEIKAWDVPANNYLKKSNIFCGTGAGGDLVFGTIQSGVVIVDTTGIIKMIAGKDKGLNNNTVLDLFVDQQKNIWAALDNGIARISYNSAVSFIQGYFDIGTGYCMIKKDDHFYLGTNQALYTITQDKFRSPIKDRTDFHLVKNSNGQVWSLFVDENTGELLMGHNLGIFRIEGEYAEPISPPGLNGGWTFRYVPGNKNLMVAGTYTGLVLLKRDKKGFWKYFKAVEGFYESSRFIEWESDTTLWVAHGLKGLYRVTFSDDYSRIIQVETNNHFRGIEDYLAFSLTRINDTIIFTSSKGIYTLAERNKFKRHQLESYFLPNGPFPVQLYQDRYNNIWFFVDNGVGVLRLQEDGTYKKIINPLVPLKNKLVSGFESLYVLDKETTFFGIEDGFGQYSATNDINYHQPFHVHIRTFKSQRKPNQTYSSDGNAKDQSYIPIFQFKDNAFDITYSATWYGEGEVEFSTLLEGFDNEWSPWSAAQNRQYTRLFEGEYTFKVKARNIHGVQALPVSFKFIVLPPWYRTIWAKTAYFIILVILLLLILWITNRIAEKSRQREKLQQQMKYLKREEQLKRQALEKEKEMIRLRNEKLKDDMKHKERELVNTTMHIIQKNDFLIKIKEELQKIKKIDDKSFIENRITSVIRQIDRDIDNEEHWEQFEKHLELVHEDFLKRLITKHPNLTARELKLAAYLRMNMTSKEIASLMNITARAVENNRYKLRKKIGLSQGNNLVDYIMKI
ncbi:triple tyrosine motif-containing protein [Thermophagus xiamenensis]|uniref:Regulatory protein, luxR family n=1 Tax=Thermophagus xiamenensis TaxID=385682 RepID=A0A1I2BTV3_9BACT|nr:triple tyrosine motif-containing protein [Thermophagus xiamenensis]SFE59475.1 regulatory protein, luxR family [Thermophagus xiamenensis]